MSSWANRSAPPRRTTAKAIFFESRTAGFCSLFLDYFYSSIYSEHSQTKLYVKEGPNPISANYPIFSSTFVQPKTFQPVSYSEITWIPTTKLKSQIKQTLSVQDISVLRKKARIFFQFTDSILETCNKYMAQSHLLDTFDIGIHIRSGDKITTGEMEAIPIERYHEELKKSCKITNPNIFVMTDNSILLEDLRRISDPSWSYYSLTTSAQKGHKQDEFNLMNEKTKFDNYIQFLCELQIMQKIPTQIVTFTSNIGRFLYLTAPEESKIISLDMKIFQPV